jgi:hypothetical protein
MGRRSLLLGLVALCHVGGPAGAAAPPAAAAQPPSADAAARALVEAWRAAQNRGDFAAYKDLYATRFEGIKRAGPRVRHFDRAGWLADRARMFQPPTQGGAMAVEVEGLAVEPAGAAARVRFTQRFTRGSFSDRGPKELIVAPENGRLRIAREEMLSSEISRDAPPARDADGAPSLGERRFLFVIDEGVVLSQEPGRDAARGRPTLLPARDEVYRVRSAVDESRLDAAARRWKGRKLQLFSDAGPTCVATVKALSLLVRVHPPFATTQYWEGKADADGNPVEHGRPVPDAQVAREAWAMVEPTLVGELAGCPQLPAVAGVAGVIGWARDPDLPPPALASIIELPRGPLRTEAERLIRRRQEVVAVAAADEKPQIELRRVDGPGGAPLVVGSVEVGAWCEDYVGLTFIWRIVGPASRPRLEPLGVPALQQAFTPQAAFDVDGDGRFELFGRTGGGGLDEAWLLRSAAGFSDHDALGVTWLDCSC